MVRIKDDTSNHNAIANNQVPTDREGMQTGNKSKIQWSLFAIAVVYGYLSEGVRILGRAYSTYDDGSKK